MLWTFSKSFLTILSLKLCSKLLHLKASFYLSFTGYIFMLFWRNSFMVCYFYLLYILMDLVFFSNYFLIVKLSSMLINNNIKRVLIKIRYWENWSQTVQCFCKSDLIHLFFKNKLMSYFLTLKSNASLYQGCHMRLF